MKRGDDNELERNLRLERVVADKEIRFAVETEEERRVRLENNAATNRSDCLWRRTKMKSKTGEDGSHHTAHVSPDYMCGRCGCSFVPQTHSEKLATMLIIQNGVLTT